MRPLSASVLQNIENKLNQGLSAAAVARELGIGKTTVCDMRNNKLNITAPKSKGGAPRKLSDRERRETVRLISQNKARTAKEATKIINSQRENPICEKTVRNILKENGYKAKKKIKKPSLTPMHRRKRLEWALKHREWTVEDWKRIIWSDETKINRICSDGIQYAWVKTSDKLSPALIQPTVKFGGGNIMVWGCMTWAGAGCIEKIDGRMDATQYKSILDRALLSTIEAGLMLPEFPTEQELVFQQDNDPKHTSKAARLWFEANQIKTMNWPSQSPDLNPIEHLWAHLKRQLGKYQDSPKGVHQLWERTEAEWKKIGKEVCQNLIASMPNRIAAVIKSKGAPTKY